MSASRWTPRSAVSKVMHHNGPDPEPSGASPMAARSCVGHRRASGHQAGYQDRSVASPARPARRALASAPRSPSLSALPSRRAQTVPAFRQGRSAPSALRWGSARRAMRHAPSSARTVTPAAKRTGKRGSGGAYAITQIVPESALQGERTAARRPALILDNERDLRKERIGPHHPPH
jgi:hypothetical protein